MKVRGERVLVDFPELKKSNIELTPEIQQSVDLEEVKKWEKLTVFAVGDKVDDIIPGDKVTISRTGLEMSTKIEIDEKDKLLVDAHFVTIVWSSNYK